MKKQFILILLSVLNLTVYAIVPPRSVADTARYNELRRAMERAQVQRAPMRETETCSQHARVFPRVPVLMVNYADMSFRVSKADVDSMFNAEHFTRDGATGSVRKYFYDQSDGQYNPQFDIYGPVTVSHNYAYYGGTSKGGELVLEACALLDNAIDFSLYDLDNDGYVDLTYAVYAGPPGSDAAGISRSWISNPSSLIWPHYYVIDGSGTGGYARVFDGKTINAYEVSGELDGFDSNETTTVMAGVGLACHEFGHGMGLPDLYTTNSGSQKTCGMWDVMDYGCYNNNVRTPAGYSAYERWFMGWKNPRLINTAADITLTALNAGGESLLISPTGAHNMNGLNPAPTDFYLLENRQPTGWDAYLPGHDLLITHIRYNDAVWNANQVNNTVEAMGVDIVEADGVKPTTSQSGHYGKPGDTYPTGATSFTECVGYPVTDITVANNQVLFRFMGGAATMDEVSILPLEGDEEYFTLTGQPIRPEAAQHGIFIVRSNGKTTMICKF